MWGSVYNLPFITGASSLQINDRRQDSGLLHPLGLPTYTDKQSLTMCTFGVCILVGWCIHIREELTLAWVRAAFFTFSWDCSSLKFLDHPSVLVSLAATPRSSYRDIVVSQCSCNLQTRVHTHDRYYFCQYRILDYHQAGQRMFSMTVQAFANAILC